jgi:PD-(D/E)XK nuclease superfamily
VASDKGYMTNAKYRYQEIDGSYHPMDDDLDKMRRYRDKICYRAYDPRKPCQKPQKVVSSVYVVYPGTYLEHEPDEAEIGALPLVPTMTQNDRLDVEEAIKDILWFVKLL